MTQKYKIKYSNELKKIFEVARRQGGEVRFVGGAVRNFFLYNQPIESGDIDLSINLPVDVVSKAFQEAGAKVITKYATNIVVLNYKVFEITSTRRDENCDGRYAEMIFTPNFKEDAKRRDFTINALYMNEEGEIFDFFNGMQDIQNRVVRFIGNPEFRIEEDGLRIWRFFRFSCLYAKELNEEGFQACVSKKSILNKISKERVTHEMLKLLKGEENQIKLTLSKMLEGGILNNQDFDIKPSLPHDNFERLVVLNQGNFCDQFLYTSKQKKLIKLYNKVRQSLHSKAFVYKLYYTTKNDIFCIIINIAKSLNEIKDFYINPPTLPFSHQDIIKEGFEGAEISNEFDKRLNEFCNNLC